MNVVLVCRLGGMRRPRSRNTTCTATCLPRRDLTSDMLLPEGSEQQIDTGFVGTVGAFEIYRGTVRGHRMANLRVILR